MARVLAAHELPRFTSLRDTRDRLDLVTEKVGLGATAIKSDRIVYHPGDTAAAHYHVGSLHVFYVLRGSAVAHVVEPGQVHWFENDTEEEFAFVELWAPPPAETVWTEAGDVCTWRPVASTGVEVVG